MSAGAIAGPWFYAPSLDTGLVRLDDEESHHLGDVRRIRIGDSVVLFDGRGRVAEARLHTLERRGGATLEVASIRHHEAPQPALRLACAVPKGDRSATLLEMATQLGVQTIVPLVCERSVSRFEERHRPRWTRIVLDAAKQSRRPHLPRIDAEAPAADVCRSAVAAGERCWIADPRGAATPPGETVRGTVFIGPEGGFTEAERSDLIRAGAMPLSLSDGILRIECAAAAALSLLRHPSMIGLPKSTMA